MRKREFFVIGLGTFGSSVAQELVSKGANVLAIDMNEDKVKDIAPLVTQAVVADATEEKALRALSVSDFECAIVAIGESMEDSILATLLLKELNVNTIIVKGINAMHAKIVAKVGADRVVYPEYEIAKKLADSIMSPNILEEIELSREYNIIEIIAPRKYWGKTIRETGIRSTYRADIIAIKRKTPIITEEGETEMNEEMILVPGGEDDVKENDILVIIGKEVDLEEIKRV